MKRRIVWGTVIVMALIFVVIIACDFLVSYHAKGRIYADVESVPHRNVGIVLGTSPI